MPIRVRARPGPGRDPSTGPDRPLSDFEMPEIQNDDSFRTIVKKLSLYIRDVIELPSTFEQLRTTAAGNSLRVLVDHLTSTTNNPAIINALLALKWHYAAESDGKGLGEARSNACEIVAWRILTRLSEREAVDYCLFEIPDYDEEVVASGIDAHGYHYDEEADEMSPLLTHVVSRSDNPVGQRKRVGSTGKRTQLLSSLSKLTTYTPEVDDDDAQESSIIDPSAAFIGLNALEIAAVADAKRFLSQHIVQKIVTGIWQGDIVYWDSLSPHATKHPRFYNPAKMDPFSRLRVPKYLKTWEVLFFGAFLLLYYLVLVGRSNGGLRWCEVMLFVWIAAFCYDELSEWLDAGSIFYAADVWNLFDMAIIAIGVTFAVLRIVGLTEDMQHLNDRAFDVLSLEALFMVPRICSILSLSPYWGTLIPCLKEMGKDFFKFMLLVVIIYLGFLTTFSLVGRDSFSLSRMTWILTKIFFGNSGTGFDVMQQIDPMFGPPLMVIFITLSSFLLMGSLTGMLSNSFSRVITHAREEYLYVYSVYVLEASTSNRLTHFYPPFNLLALVLFRPWRLLFRNDDRFRAGRILLLKLTHWPIVIAIRGYEVLRHNTANSMNEFKGPTSDTRRGARVQKQRQQQDRQQQDTLRSGTLGAKTPVRPDVLAHAPSQVIQPVGDTLTRPMTRPPSVREDGDAMDAPTAMETQIAELGRKIEQLTAVVMAMQENPPPTPSRLGAQAST